MKITFDKVIRVSLNFDPKDVAECAITLYKMDRYTDVSDNSDDPIYDDIYDYIGDNIYYILDALGLTQENKEAMEALDYDVTKDLIQAANDYIKAHYNIKQYYENTKN